MSGSGAALANVVRTVPFGTRMPGAIVGSGPEAIAPSYAAVVMADGPVGYWRLDELSGASAADTSVGKNAGTISGGVTLGQPSALGGPKGGSSMTFDGTGTGGSGLIAMPSLASYNFGAGSYAIEAWVKLMVVGHFVVAVGKGSNLVPGWRAFVNGSNQPQLFWGDDAGSYTASTLTLSVNAWHYVLWGYDAAAAKLTYAVDSQYETIAAVNHSVSNSNSLTLGYDGNNLGYEFPGGLDEVAVYGQALSATQAANHYAAGVGHA